MATTLTLTALNVDPGVGQNYVYWSESSNPCLPYMQIKSVEIWASQTNNRATATKIATVTEGTSYMHQGTGSEVTWYYWGLINDMSDQQGPWFPTSATGGVSSKTLANNAIAIAFTSDTLFLQSDSAGKVPAGNYTGASVTASVKDGTTDVSAQWTYAWAPSTGVTINTTTGATVSVTALGDTTDTGYVEVTATKTGTTPAVTMKRRWPVIKVKTGMEAKALILSASSQVFQISKAIPAVTTPSSITLTATKVNIPSVTNETDIIWKLTSGTYSGATLNAQYSTGATLSVSPGSMTTDAVTWSATCGVYTDTMTVVKVREGSDAITTYLTNESIAVAAAADGTVSAGALSGASTTMKVFVGSTDVSTGNSWTYKIVASNCTVSPNQTTAAANNTFTITAFDQNFDLATVTITAQKTNYPDQVKTLTLSKSKTGAKGADGATSKDMWISTTAQAIQIPKTGSANPASVTLTANKSNTTATVSWKVTAGSYTHSNGTTYTSASAAISTGDTLAVTTSGLGTDVVTFQASLTDGVTLTDTLSLVKVREGLDGAAGSSPAVAFLTNEAATIATDVNGSAATATYNAVQTTMKVYLGTADDTANWTVTAPTQTNATVSLVSGTTYRVETMSQDTASITFRATPNTTRSNAGYTAIDKIMNLSKSRQGSQGSQGPTGNTGAAAQAFFLEGSAVAFQVPKTGSVTPASITLTATKVNFTGAVAWSAPATDYTGGASLTGSGLSGDPTGTLTVTYANMLKDAVTFTATCGGFTDKFTVLIVREGTDSLIGFLTNEAHTVTAAYDGTVAAAALTSAVTTMKVYQGATDVSSQWTYKIAATGCTVTPNQTTAAANNTFTIATVTANTDTVYVDITASKSGQTDIVKRFTITKAKQGNRGSKTSMRSNASYTAWADDNATMDAAANAAIVADWGSGPFVNDQVVLTNTAGTFAATKVYTTSNTWRTPGKIISGDLFVEGSITAASFNGSIFNGYTFNGAIFQTAAPTAQVPNPRRIVISASTNRLEHYQAGDTSPTITIGDVKSGTGGYIYAALNEASWAGVYMTNAGGGPCISLSSNNASGRALEIVNTLAAKAIRIVSQNGIDMSLGGTTSSNYGYKVDCSTNASVGFYQVGANASNAFDGALTVGGTLGVQKLATFTGSVTVQGPSGTTAGTFAGIAAHGMRGTASGFPSLDVYVATNSGYAGYAYNSSGWFPFTGCHDALMPKSEVWEPGDIVVDCGPVRKTSLSDTICRIKVSSKVNEKGVLGVITAVRPLDAAFPPTSLTDETEGGWKVCEQFDNYAEIYNRVDVNALGEGQVNVCGLGGDIEIGDLIVASAMPGKGMKQADDLVRGYTLGRAREAASFASPNDVKTIAVIYLAG